MARPRRPDPKLAEIERRDPPPKMHRYGSWTQSLDPLLKDPGVWYMIRSCDTPLQAQEAQSNLTKRQVNIPQPDHDWVFSARGCEVFAIYHGKGRPRVRKAPSAGGTRTRQQKG
jgi:hypothetical protein